VKKISRWIIGILSVVVVLPSLLGGALYFLNQKGFFNLDQIEVLVDNGDLKSNYLKPQAEKIEKIIEQSRGQSLWSVDLNKIKKEIDALAWVQDVILVRQWPGTLRAKITPFDVKMLLLTKHNEFMPIVKNGEVLPAIDVKYLPDATILRGESFQRSPDLRRKAVKVWEQIPQDGTFSKPKISEVYYKEKEGFWVTMMKNGIEVKLGESDVSLKSKRVSQVLDYLESNQFDARVIDADLSQKVLVRLRKDP
jgi:cell division protein FtsQ